MKRPSSGQLQVHTESLRMYVSHEGPRDPAFILEPVTPSSVALGLCGPVFPRHGLEQPAFYKQVHIMMTPDFFLCVASL